jgi:hypothetical protein
MPQQGALAAATAAHDDEDVAAPHREGQVALDDKAAIGHGQVVHRDVGLG